MLARKRETSGEQAGGFPRCRVRPATATRQEFPPTEEQRFERPAAHCRESSRNHRAGRPALEETGVHISLELRLMADYIPGRTPLRCGPDGGCQKQGKKEAGQMSGNRAIHGELPSQRARRGRQRGTRCASRRTPSVPPSCAERGGRSGVAGHRCSGRSRSNCHPAAPAA